METNDNYSPMIHLLLTTIAAVVLVGCGEPRQSSPPETQPAETVAEDAKREPPTAKVKAPNIPIYEAAELKTIKSSDPAVQALEVKHQKDLAESKGVPMPPLPFQQQLEDAPPADAIRDDRPPMPPVPGGPIPPPRFPIPPGG